MTDPTTPLISVLITVYNREKYLSDAIESALAQTWQDLEVIIVDNCSTDNSFEVAGRYTDDPRVRLYRNDENIGQFPNRNKAADLARGRYLKYLDSDDALLPHCLEMMVRMMERHPAAGVLLWSSEGDDWYPFELSPLEVYRRGFLSGRRFERAPLSTLLRADTFRAVGGFDLRWRYCADTDLIYKLARRAPVLYGPHGLVFYRVHEGQIFTAVSDSMLQRQFEESAIKVDALRHPECPLPSLERSWALARAICGSLRTALRVAVTHGRPAAAGSFLRTVGFSPVELFPLLSRKPVPPTPQLPDTPDWDEFPHSSLAQETTCTVSVIVTPDQADWNFHLCLDSLRHQRLTQIEVLIAVDDRQDDIRDHVVTLYDPRFRCIDVPDTATTWERFNLAVKEAGGACCKFIGPELPILYPYALEIEVAVLNNRSGREFLSAGCAGFTLGGLDFTPEEALALDAGTEGKYLRVDPACALIRRTALGDTPFDSSLGQWALVDLLYRLAARSGAILGPYGLSIAWRRYEPWPMGELPEILKERTLALYRELKNVQPVADWTALVAEGRTLDSGMPSRCQWDSPWWIPPDTTTSRREKKPCP